jgi:hypothetical protein
MRNSPPPRALLPSLAAILTIGGGVGAPAVAQEQLVVHTETGTPVIATELLIATGPADEPAGLAGIAHLAARAVTRPILPTLDSLEAHMVVTPHKDAVGFTLIAAPDAWNEAVRVLLVAIFRDPVDAASVAAERAALEAELLGRRDNPADAAVRAADAAIFGEAHPWGRPAVGVPETVRRPTHAQVDEFLRGNFRAGRAYTAVVGPIETTSAERQILPYLRDADTVSVTPIPAPEPEDSPVRRDYNSVTTWITASFPFGPDGDVEALRMLAHVVDDELAFGPTRRSVYDSRSEVVRRIGGGEVRFTVVVPPEEAAAWARRVSGIVEVIAESPLLEEGWLGRIRRYRGERLHQLASPEDRAGALARSLLVAGTGGEPLPHIEDLSVDRLRRAAASLGEPTVVLLGPFLDDPD